MTLTPEQFNKLALKQDLIDMEERLNVKFATKDDVREILNAIDTFAKAVSDVKEEQTANVGAHDRMQESINKHEKVLTHLSPELMKQVV